MPEVMAYMLEDAILSCIGIPTSIAELDWECVAYQAPPFTHTGTSITETGGKCQEHGLPCEA